MSFKNPKPVIGITCCSTVSGIHQQQFVGDKYIRAVVEGCNAIPLLIPAFGEDVIGVLDHIDGLFLTGSYSNMEPHHFGGEEPEVEMPRDPKRDKTNLSLLNKALKMKLPVYGVCRGFQEMNVALGGTLHQELVKVDGLLEHREDKTLTIDEQYAVAHEVSLRPNGILANAMEGELTQMVNSLHGQGLDKLGKGLVAEATAPDGLVEALSLENNESFYLAVQWHPEWKIDQHPFYKASLNTFAQACKEFRINKA